MAKTSHYGHVIIVLLLFLIMATNVKAADDKNVARTEWMGGFVKMEAADKAAAANAVAALDLYKQALEVFESVRRKYPQWNPSLLNYRINYCQQKIQELSAKLESQSNQLSREELVQLSNRQAKLLQASEDAKKELTARVEFLTESLQRARQEAAKESSLQTTAAALAAAKENLERKVADLELRLKSMEGSMTEAVAKSQNVLKLEKELENANKKQKKADEAYLNAKAQLENNKRELDAAQRELKHLRRVKEDNETSLRVVNELAVTRKSDIDALQVNLRTAEGKLKLKDKVLDERDKELGRLDKQLKNRQSEVDELKRLRQADAEVIADLRKKSEEASLRNLQKELSNAMERLKKLDAEAIESNAELERLRKSSEAARAQALAKEEANLALASQAGKLKSKLELTEGRNIQLTAELNELKIVLDKRASDAKVHDERMKAAEKRAAAMNALQQKLTDQVALSRKQESEIAEQNKKIASLTEQVGDLGAKYQKEAAARKKLLGEPDVEKRLEEAAKSLALQKKEIEKMRESAAADAKSIAAITAKWKEASDALELQKKEVERVRGAADANAEKLSATIHGLTEKSQEQNKEIDRLLASIQDLNNRLKAEEQAYDKKIAGLEQKAAQGNEFLQKQLSDARVTQQELTKEKEKNNTLEAKTKQLNAEKEGLQAQIDKLLQEQKILVAKTEASSGLIKNVSDLETQMQKMVKEAASLKNTHDAYVKSAEAKLASLNDIIKQKNGTIEQLKSETSTAGQWLDKINEINAKLEKENKRRIALETALVDMEEKVKSQTAPAIAPAIPAAAQNTQSFEAELRISRERERLALVKGFLRQGTDAERQGKIEAARHNYQKALELDADNKLALQRMGLIAAGLGNDEEAISFLKRAFRFDPDDMDTLLAIGFAEVRQGKPDWAIAYLGRAVALNPGSSYANRSYGSALLSLGWTQAAELQLMKACKLDAKDPEAPFNLAVLMATSQPPRLEEAAKWYKIAVKNGAQPDPGLDQLLK